MSGFSHSQSVYFSGWDEVQVSPIHLAAKMLEPTTDWSIGVPQGIMQLYKWKATEVIKPRDSSRSRDKKRLEHRLKPFCKDSAVLTRLLIL